jgi:serine/threonine protein kinase
VFVLAERVGSCPLAARRSRAAACLKTARCSSAAPGRSKKCGVAPTQRVRSSLARIITPPLALAPCTRLGPYEVVSAIGAGGMGEVYRATDTKLKRRVAIKILPPSLPAGHDRLMRFQREAEVLASLNHPHIAGIYGLEECGGASALVMELVEGEDCHGVSRVARSPSTKRRPMQDYPSWSREKEPCARF